MSIRVKFDDRQLKKWLLKTKGLPKLQSQAVNEAARTVRTNTARKIRDETSVKAAAVKARFGSKGGGLVITRKASANSLFAEIKGSKFTTPLNKQFFSVSSRKATKNKPPRATVKLKGRRVVFRNSQLSSSGSIRARGIYSGNFRFNDSKYQDGPLTGLRTFSIRSQLTKTYVTNDLTNVSFKAYEKAFIRAARRKGLLTSG